MIQFFCKAKNAVLIVYEISEILVQVITKVDDIKNRFILKISYLYHIAT